MTIMRAHHRVNIIVLAIALGLLFASRNGRVEAAVKTTPSNKTDLATITTDMVGSNVEVETTIKSITPPPEGSRAPVKIELTDATGTMTLVVWPDMYETLRTQSPLSTGDVIYLNAKVATYRDNLQLKIQAPTDVKIVRKAEPEKPAAEAAAPATPTLTAQPPTPAAPAPPPQPAAAATTTPLAGITTAMIGKPVTVQATITEIREPREGSKAPYTVTLTQDSVNVPLVCWSDQYKQIKDKLKVGTRVRINGQVSEHRGTLQLKIRSAADVTTVTAP